MACGQVFELWLRESKSPWLAVIGIVILGVYGVLPTLQTATFGRA
ncbi:hypothetical protein QUA35_18890 [Microcoleus sp. N9_B2]